MTKQNKKRNEILNTKQNYKQKTTNETNTKQTGPVQNI